MPWLVQEQKNKHDPVGSIIKRNRFVSSRFAKIFLTASALAGARAINRHYQIRWIQRETDLRVQGLRIFLIASALLVQEQKNKHDPVGSIINRN